MLPVGSTERNRWLANATSVDLRRPTPVPRPVTVAALPQDLTVDLAASALIVVDMQNDFCHADGWLASIGVDVGPARRPIDPLAEHLPTLRAAGVPVIWLNWGNRPDRANLPPNVIHVYDPDGSSTGIGHPLGGDEDRRVLTEGSWSAAIVDDLEVAEADIRVDKFRMSGFWDTSLDSILRNLRVDTLLFAGVNADQCVLATLVDGACIGYDVVLLEDACATTSPDFCWDATVYNVRQCFGFTTTLAEIAGGLR